MSGPFAEDDPPIHLVKILTATVCAKCACETHTTAKTNPELPLSPSFLWVLPFTFVIYLTFTFLTTTPSCPVRGRRICSILRFTIFWWNRHLSLYTYILFICLQVCILDFFHFLFTDGNVLYLPWRQGLGQFKSLFFSIRCVWIFTLVHRDNIFFHHQGIFSIRFLFLCF